jgi:hypothetical protein
VSTGGRLGPPGERQKGAWKSVDRFPRLVRSSCLEALTKMATESVGADLKIRPRPASAISRAPGRSPPARVDAIRCETSDFRNARGDDAHVDVSDAGLDRFVVRSPDRENSLLAPDEMRSHLSRWLPRFA